MKEDHNMKHTMRILTFLMLAVVVGAGQAWAEALPDLGYIVCNEANVIGGTLTFYTDADCENAIDFSGDKSVNLSSEDLAPVKDEFDENVTIGYTVYIKVAPDVAHTLYGFSQDRIRIEKSLGSGSAQAPRRSAQGPETNSLIDAAEVNAALGIYSFTMPASWGNVTVSATFPDKTTRSVTYNGGNSSVAAYELDGTEFVLGTSTEDTWYVCDDDLEYSHGLTLASTVHLILADGYTLTVDGTLGSDGKTLTLYGKEGGSGELRATSYAGTVTIGTDNRFVTNYNSSVKTAEDIFSGNISDLDDINGKTLTPFLGLLLDTGSTAIIDNDKTTPDITIGDTPYYIYDINEIVELSYANDGMVRVTATGDGASIANQKLTMGTSDVVITTEGITVEDIHPQNYTGDELTPEITVRIGEELLKENTDYTCEINGDHDVAGDYDVTITGVGTCFGTVTKTFTISQKATISVEWKDKDDLGKLRPESLTFKLLANDSETECTVTLSESNNWSETVNGLTPCNGETLIVYTWSLVSSTPETLSNNYESGDPAQSTTETGATAIFTYTRKTGSLTVSNTVVSDLADDANVEFTYTVKLTPANITGTYGDMEFTDGEASVTLKAGESATATGIMYGTTYTVAQADADGFTITGKDGDTGTISTTQSDATFTNTRQTGSLTVTNMVYPSDDDTPFEFRVTLSDKSISGEYGDMTFDAGEATFPLTGLTTNNSRTATGLPTTVEYTVTQDNQEGFSTTKTGDTGTISTTLSEAAFKNIMLTEARFDIDWCDGGNTSSRPELTTTLLSKIDGDESQQVQTITLNEENDWQATITNLPMYNDAGLEIAYSWREIESVPSGYLLTDYLTGKDASYTYTLKTSATVTIEWDDADDQDGIRPETLTATLSNGTDVTLNPANSWTATVDNLPMYNDEGYKIEYNWTQDEDVLPEGYTMTNLSKEGIVTTITNSHTPEKTQVKVSKVWNDNNNKEGFRPTSVTVHLKKGETEIESAVLNAGNEWTHTWSGLQKYENGTAINYTVTEDEVANYETPVIEKVSETEWEYTVTNSRELEETEATVKVVWVDGNNELHNRPASVTATLLADGTATENTVTMNAENNWTATLTGLQKYSNGEEVDYTWLQGTLPEGYVQTNSAVAETVTTFTDSYYPAVTVTITGHHNEATYDGTEHAVSGYEAVSSYSLYTDADFFISGMAQASQTTVGTAYMGLAASQFVNNNANYNGKVTFVIAENGDGYQTITPAPVTVKADDKSKKWGTATDPELTATVTGMVNDEDATTLIAYTIDRAKGDFTNGIENSGEYTITPSGNATQGNYTVTYETGTFTIEGKPVTIQDVQGNDVSSVDDAYAITQDQNGVTLTLVVPDETTTPPSIDIPVAVEVNHVVIDRLFEKGKAATVYLPFSIEVSKIGGGTFHTFVNVDETTTPLWTVTYSAPLADDATLQAGTPYIFMPDDSNGGKIVVDNGNEKISICTADQHKDTKGQWEFIGTYESIVWLSDPDATGYKAERAAEIGLVYGFAAEDKTFDGKDYAVGQFVKVGSGASIDPNRAYLKRTVAQQAPALGGNGQGDMEMPSAMRVVILDNGETTSLSEELRVKSEDFATAEGWYTIDGRKLDKQPTAKGLYIHNGRKEVIR